MLIPDESEKSALNKPEFSAQYPRTGSSSGPSGSIGGPAFPQANLDQPPSYEASSRSANADSAFAAPGGGTSNIYATTTDISSPPVPHKDAATPPSFFRHAPPNIDRTTFNPMYLTPKKTRLASGFPICPPPVHGAQSHRHPFATRDVTQEDWNW
jgi:hypothetical protein